MKTHGILYNRNVRRLKCDWALDLKQKSQQLFRWTGRIKYLLLIIHIHIIWDITAAVKKSRSGNGRRRDSLLDLRMAEPGANSNKRSVILVGLVYSDCCPCTTGMVISRQCSVRAVGYKCSIWSSYLKAHGFSPGIYVTLRDLLFLVVLIFDVYVSVASSSYKEIITSRPSMNDWRKRWYLLQPVYFTGLRSGEILLMWNRDSHFRSGLLRPTQRMSVLRSR